MVRHDHDYYDHQNTNREHRCSAAAGVSILGQDARCPERFRETAPRAALPYQPKGRFAFIRATSVSCTRAALARLRLRFAFFTDIKCRREERDLKTFPRAVILKRFATDLRVLLRATGFGIRRER
jgi:hypothetical protein